VVAERDVHVIAAVVRDPPVVGLAVGVGGDPPVIPDHVPDVEAVPVFPQVGGDLVADPVAARAGVVDAVAQRVGHEVQGEALRVLAGAAPGAAPDEVEDPPVRDFFRDREYVRLDWADVGDDVRQIGRARAGGHWGPSSGSTALGPPPAG
jgi:hypothetical protein